MTATLTYEHKCKHFLHRNGNYGIWIKIAGMPTYDTGKQFILESGSSFLAVCRLEKAQWIQDGNCMTTAGLFCKCEDSGVTAGWVKLLSHVSRNTIFVADSDYQFLKCIYLIESVNCQCRFLADSIFFSLKTIIDNTHKQKKIKICFSSIQNFIFVNEIIHLSSQTAVTGKNLTNLSQNISVHRGQTSISVSILAILDCFAY